MQGQPSQRKTSDRAHQEKASASVRQEKSLQVNITPIKPLREELVLMIEGESDQIFANSSISLSCIKAKRRPYVESVWTPAFINV